MAQFRMIKELAPSAASLTSNVPITEVEWTPGTYVAGDRRYLPASFDLYEVTAVSTSEEPTAGAALETPSWVRVGKVNRWRMFSESVGEQTVMVSPIVLDIATNPAVNAVALFGVEAATVEVVTYAGEAETFRITKSMTNLFEVTDWYEYYFQPVVQISEGVILNMPSFGTTRMVITIANSSSSVAVGKLVIGTAVALGDTYWEFGTGISDFSFRERDQWGGFKVTERPFARPGDFAVHMPSIKAPGVLRELAAVRAKPTVYIGSPDSPESIVIGFYKEVVIRRVGPNHSRMEIEIEGLI